MGVWPLDIHNIIKVTWFSVFGLLHRVLPVLLPKSIQSYIYISMPACELSYLLTKNNHPEKTEGRDKHGGILR